VEALGAAELASESAEAAVPRPSALWRALGVLAQLAGFLLLLALVLVLVTPGPEPFVEQEATDTNSTLGED
jgi:hypothetical protein